MNLLYCRPMNLEILISNLTNPTLLFFLLGVIAVLVKSDLEIPAHSIKFISLYLLFSIGFKGGQELSHSPASWEMFIALAFGFAIAAIIPFYVFFLLKKRLGPHNAGGIAATYGSVSAVTFVSAVAFLEALNVSFSGHMVAVMALMEVPAIVVAVFLIAVYSKESKSQRQSLGSIIHHSLSNGSVLIVLGSLLIGIFSDAKHAEGIKPFTTDIFKGFLAIFLLDMGMLTARRVSAFKEYGSFAAIVAVILPLVNGVVVALISRGLMSSVGDRFMMSVLAASASYIAVPAALKLAAPKADPGLFVPMAIGVTFPLNITLGIPLFYALVSY